MFPKKRLRSGSESLGRSPEGLDLLNEYRITPGGRLGIVGQLNLFTVEGELSRKNLT